MSDQPKPTGGEWMFRLVEYFTAMDTVNFRQLCSQLSEEINAALDAEREKGFREAAMIYKPARDDDRMEIQELRDQLAAIAAAQQPLVDAMNQALSDIETSNDPISTCSKIRTALAKVKEGK